VARSKAYREYLARWKRINDFQTEELRRTTPTERVRQFFRLMKMAKAMKWETSSAEEIEMVRSRWRRLREAYLGKARR
jgi:hypothetical protein